MPVPAGAATGAAVAAVGPAAGPAAGAVGASRAGVISVLFLSKARNCMTRPFCSNCMMFSIGLPSVNSMPVTDVKATWVEDKTGKAMAAMLWNKRNVGF